MAGHQRPKVTVVVPVYRNRDTLRELSARIHRVFDEEGLEHEILFVDDACPEGSFQVLEELAREDDRVGVVALAENVGQNRAVLAGLGFAGGDAAVIMDADLQDPVEAVPRLLARLREGYDAVFAGRRGAYESFGRLITSRFFKFLLHLLCGVPADAGIFVAMNRRVIESLLAMEEPRPFIVAMIGCTGLTQVSIPVERVPRESGRSAYNTRARIRSAYWAISLVLRRRFPVLRPLLTGVGPAPTPRVRALVGARFVQSTAEPRGAP